MTRLTRTPQELADAIAKKKKQLHLLEAKQRDKEKARQQTRWMVAGKVVDACGLLDVPAGELESILKLGLAERILPEQEGRK